MARSVVTLVVIGAATLGAAPAASAQIVLPAPWPAPAIGLDRRQPPYPCNRNNDGQFVVWDGWLWQCNVVIGDRPPFQWEPIRKI